MNQDIVPFCFLDLNRSDTSAESADYTAINAPSEGERVAAELAEGLDVARREGWAQGHAEGLVVGKQEGHESGYRDGYREGVEKGLSEAQEAAALLQQAAESWKDADTQIADFLERAVLQLSLEVARHVIAREVRDTTARMLADDLSRLTHELGIEQTQVLWVLHSKQIALLKQHLRDSLPESWSFSGDDTMAPGGVRIRVRWPDRLEEGRTVTQEWDARIETRWAELVSRILEGN